MPMLSRNMPMVRQMRRLATRTRLEQGQHKNNSVLKAGSWYQDRPAREENFAAAQIHQQKQPIRASSNRSVSLVDLGAFRPVTLPDQAHVPALPNRNNMAAAQNAMRGRSVRASDQLERRMDYIHYRHADRDNQSETYPEAESSSQQERSDSRPEMRMDEDEDQDLEVRSVREAVFGVQDEIDEDAKQRAQADAELLRRVAAQKVVETPKPTISKKVIQPYNSYRNHRTRWAEFRHSMIYGRSSF